LKAPRVGAFFLRHDRESSGAWSENDRGSMREIRLSPSRIDDFIFNLLKEKDKKIVSFSRTR
jgi:hypothetical protein